MPSDCLGPHTRLADTTLGTTGHFSVMQNSQFPGVIQDKRRHL